VIHGLNAGRVACRVVLDNLPAAITKPIGTTRFSSGRWKSTRAIGASSSTLHPSARRPASHMSSAVPYLRENFFAAKRGAIGARRRALAWA
jgi:hypothetical protein